MCHGRHSYTSSEVAVIDTVKVQSQTISDSLAHDIERSLVRRSGEDCSTGELLYELYSGQVPDERLLHGIRITIMRSRIVKDPTPGADVMGRRTKTVRCDPYLWMEGSVHKAMLGHNVWGGPRDLGPSVSWLVSDVSRRLGLELPHYAAWDLMRVDWAETFDLGSFDHCQDFIRSMNSCRYPRREPERYGDNSLNFPGRATSLRIYHKGPEFAGESFRKLSRVFARDELEQLAAMSHRTLRVEASIKRPKITEYHSLSTKIPHVKTDWLREVHNKEVKKVMREVDSDLTIVRDSQSVLARLHSIYPDRNRMVRSLFATWVQLSGLGENTVKEGMFNRSFYRHRKMLIDAGIAWTGSDVLMGDTRGILAADFRPVSTDIRCSSSEHPEVTRMLEEHRTLVA